MKLTIPVPTYMTNVEIFISSNQKKLDKYDRKIAKEFGAESNGFDVIGRSYNVHIRDGVRTACVAINKNHLSFGVLAHEIMHCVFYILDHCGLNLSYESEEAFTYLQGYLIESIHRELGSTLLPDG